MSVVFVYMILFWKREGIARIQMKATFQCGPSQFLLIKCQTHMLNIVQFFIRTTHTYAPYALISLDKCVHIQVIVQNTSYFS